MELVIVFLAALRQGVVVTLLNPRLSPEDITDLAQGNSVVFTTESHATHFNADTVIVTEAQIARWADEDALVHAVQTTDTTPAWMQFTSGTSGKPKAVIHCHGHPLIFQQAFGRELQLSTQDVVLSVSKTFFAYGLGNSIFYPLQTGATTILVPGHPERHHVMSLIENHRVSVLFSVPSFYARAVKDDLGSAFSQLRLLVSAGEPLTINLRSKLTELCKAGQILDSLGCTEVGQAFASSHPPNTPADSVGRSIPPFDVRVVDEAGTPTRQMVNGRLQVRGPTIPSVGTQSPWIDTGDLACMDDRGFIFLKGRVDDIEIVGGINLHPVEVETVIASHPDVEDVAVCSIRDEDGDSRLTAFVVLTDGAITNESDILASAKSMLPAVKVPRYVQFRNVLPRTHTGKLQRFKLRQGSVTHVQPD
jgi:acyl-coenzyme A synthetase/AMP-(fatty) acid ligase